MTLTIKIWNESVNSWKEWRKRVYDSSEMTGVNGRGNRYVGKITDEER